MSGAGTKERPIKYPSLVMPEGVVRSAVTIWSHGLALDGDVFRPSGLLECDRVPGIVLAHGIGGDKESGERYAAKFAAAGMIAVCFTQASWGRSQGRLYFDGPAPDDGVVKDMSSVRMARELIDPLEWAECYRSAVDFIEGEPNVDPTRIGAWGTSFGGGTVLLAAAGDTRIRALSIQVGAVFPQPDARVRLGRERAIQIARGDLPPLPQEGELRDLPGTPHFAQMARLDVDRQVEQIGAPTLIIDAEQENFFDPDKAGAAVYRRLGERGVPTYYEVIPGIDHYGIYFGGYERSSQLALDWFAKHL